MNIKLFLATPAFDGKVNVQYAISLAETSLICAKNHIQIDYRIVTSGSLLCAERNRLVDSFMRSDCTHMLCVDSDLGWPAQAVIEMLKKDKEFVAGCYPARTEKAFLFRPVLQENGSLVVDPEKQLIKMNYIPAGFLLFRRSVIEKMLEKFQHLRFQPKDPKVAPGYALFNTELMDGEFWGEDYMFCHRVRECGVDIWVDPLIQFDHAGNVGMLAQVLSDKPPEVT